MPKGPDIPRSRLILLVVLVIVVVAFAGYWKFGRSSSSTADTGGVVTAAAPTTDPCATDGTVPGAADGTTPAVATPTTPATATDPTTGCPVTTPATGTGAVGVPTKATGKKGLKGASKGAQAASAPAAALSRAVSNGANATSNTPYGVSVATLVYGLLQKNGLNATVAVDLVPGEGGVDTRAKGAVKAYRSSVTAAVLRITFSDAATQTQWDTNAKGLRSDSVASFLTLLHSIFPDATATASIVNPSGLLNAVGDAAPKRTPAVSVLG